MKTSATILASVALFAFLTGCSDPPAAEPVVEPVAAAVDDHHHGAGPHGGAIGDWGGGAYHTEFTVDHDKQEAVVYILGSDAKTPAPVKADTLLLTINDPAFQVELTAQPQAGEAEGSSSRFVGQHESLGKVQEFAGTITGEVDGTPYTGEFSEEAHEHGHDH